MTSRDRIVLGVLALVAVVAGFYMGVLKPSSQEVADLDEQIAAAEQRRDTALADVASAAAAREQYKRDQATLAVLGKAVPADDGVPSLLYQIHKAARKSKIDFQAVRLAQGASSAPSGSSTTEAQTQAPTTPGVVPGPDGLSLLPLKITFTGDFFKLDRFLKELYRFAKIGDESVDVRGRLLTVDAIALSPSDGKLSAEVTANAYVAASQDAPAAAGSAGAASGSATTPASASGSTTSGATGADAADTESSTSTSTSTGAAE